MSDDLDKLKGDFAKEAAKKAASDALANAKDRLESAPISWKLKVLGGVVAAVVVVVAGMALVAKLWTYATLAVILAGIGGATYLVVKPRVVALKQRAEEKLLAGRREREEQDRVDAAAKAEQAKAKKLEDELEALRKKA